MRRVALITGGSRGIGKAVAIELARGGMDVVVNYLPEPGDKNLGDAESVKEKIVSAGRACLLQGADVACEKDVTRMAEEVFSKFNRLDVLVNNAGILADKTLKKMTREEWDRVISVNLGSVYNCCSAFLDVMTKQGAGRIVNISSVVAFTGNFGQSNYAASKAGIMGFTRSLAREVADKGITVNAVAPGIIDTDMMKSVPDKYRSKLVDGIPMGKMGTPEEVANAVAFFADERASYITGQVLHVNGGFYM